MTVRYMVGMKIGGSAASVVVEAEDALIAALTAKRENPSAIITYVRKHNERGDRRHPHRGVTEDDQAGSRRAKEKPD